MTYKKIIIIFSAVGLLLEVTAIIADVEEMYHHLWYFCCDYLEYRDLTNIILFPGLFVANISLFPVAEYISNFVHQYAEGARHVGDWVLIVIYSIAIISNPVYFGGVGAVVLFLRRRSQRS
jgi:hypothetical protein